MFKKILGSVLFRSSGIYTLTNMINAAIPFFLLPVFTRYLSPEDYGITAMFTVLIGILVPFIGLNIHGAVTRNYFEKDKVDFPKYVFNAFVILASSSFIMYFIIQLLANQISSLSAFPRSWIWAVWLYNVTQFLNLIRLSILQVSGKAIQYALFQISNALLNAGLAIIFIVVLSDKWEGTIKAQLISSGIFSMISLFYLFKQKLIKFGIEIAYIRDALRFGIPLIPHALGGMLITMTDRVFITNMVGTEATGIYSVGFQIGTVLSLLTSSFNNAWVPYFYENLKKETLETNKKIVKQTYMYYVVLTFLTVCLILIIPFITNIMLGSEFRNSVHYAIWIIVGYYFNGLYYMVTNYIFYTSQTIYLSIMTFVTAILNIVFNYFFIKQNGAMGAAQATTLSYFITFILTWLIVSRLYKMPWLLFKYK